MAGVTVGTAGAEHGPGADPRRATDNLILEALRVLAGAAAVGLLVGGLVGGVLGRVAMRLLVLTSDDRVDGAITDDEAVVNQFTLSGTLGLVFFVALAGVALAWLYVGARQSLPASHAFRAGAWAVLLWAVVGSDIFDPEGFDFTQLQPPWFGVALFTAILLATGALIALGVERAIERWPVTWPALVLPLVAILPGFPLVIGGVVATIGARLSRWRAVRLVGAIVMTAMLGWFGARAASGVVRILR